MTDDEPLRFNSIDPKEEALLNRALNLIQYRGRSVGEMRQRLREDREIPEELIETVIAKLLSWGYLDDAAFADTYARARLSYKAMGRTRLMHELRKRRLGSDVIQHAMEGAFEEHDESELLARAVHKWLRSHPVPTDQRERKRLGDFLARRGFHYGLLSQHLDRILRSFEEHGAEGAPSTDDEDEDD